MSRNPQGCACGEGASPSTDQMARTVRPPGRSRRRCACTPSERSLLDPGEELARDVAGHVLAREAGGVEGRDARIVVPARRQRGLRGPGRPASRRRSRSRDIVLARGPLATELGGDRPCRCRRRSGTAPAARRKRSRPCWRPASRAMLDDLRRRRAAHDRVVHEQHVPAAELEVDRVQLVAHRLLCAFPARA